MQKNIYIYININEKLFDYNIIFLILVVCILITKISIQNFNNINFFKNIETGNLNYTYKEVDNLDSGPIKLKFNIISTGSLVVKQTVNFNIDNNGKGYLSLFDLFCSGDNLNNKIAKSIENANKKYSFLTKTNINDYFSDSKFVNQIYPYVIVVINQNKIM